MNTTFEATNSKSRILIVDDNSRFARSAQLFLEHTGNYFACAVNDPRRASETARSFTSSSGAPIARRIFYLKHWKNLEKPLL